MGAAHSSSSFQGTKSLQGSHPNTPRLRQGHLSVCVSGSGPREPGWRTEWGCGQKGKSEQGQVALARLWAGSAHPGLF